MTRSCAAAAIVLVLSACSDYSLSGMEKADEGEEDGESPVLDPELTVTPGEISEVICESSGHTVTVGNEGEGELEVISYGITGEGWSVEGPEAPMVLAPADTVDLALTGGVGDALLVIESNDPVQPVVDVPLSGSSDAAPSVSISTPSQNAVMDIGIDMTLSGEVSDDVDPAEELSLSWWSDVDGTLSTDAADSSGETSLSWAADGRTEGDHTLWLSAEDSCGNVTETEVAVCQQAGYTVDELDIDDWNFEGVANWDSANGWLELTDTSGYVVGTAFETSTAVSGDAVTIRFLFYMGDGSGADGLSLTALDVDRYTTFLGGSGCGIGYGGDASCTDGPALPGWSIEVDTYYNDGQDPTEEDHLMFTFDGDVDDAATWAILPEMEDNGWHEMVVEVADPHVTVSIDGTTYIDEDLSGYFAFPAYVGFTAGTGGATNRHLIDSLEVTEYICE